MIKAHLLNGDVMTIPLADQSVHCIVSSPPYWGLRDYGTGEWVGGDNDCDHEAARHKNRFDYPLQTDNVVYQGTNPGSAFSKYDSICPKCGAVRIDKQLGSEPLHDCGGWVTGDDCGECFVCHVRQYARELWRVLRDDGVCWLNLGDSYYNYRGANNRRWEKEHRKNNGTLQKEHHNIISSNELKIDRLKDKDLCGVPWRVALALQADGWYLRSDVIWCLSGGTRLYAKTQNTEGPQMLKDLVRLDPSTVQLWNGDKWTQVLGWSESPRPKKPIEIVLRSGERIGCTPLHRWPTQRGLIHAKDLQVGDVIDYCELPEALYPSPNLIPAPVGWFIGLYIAEGSMSGSTIQIAGHTKETDRYLRVKRLAEAYGGTARLYSYSGKSANIHIDCAPLLAILKMYVSGRTAKDKRLSPKCWMRSNVFLAELLDGYLSGDGHWDGKRWRLGFTRNYELEADLRTLCARLGYQLRLKPIESTYQNGKVKTFRGEIRIKYSTHHNVKQDTEIVELRHSRARKFYDVGVEGDPHLFALSSGVLTHNSKPNPMPESVTDRPTKAHEYLFLLSKSKRYFYDADAVREAPQRMSKTNWGNDREWHNEERMIKQGTYKDWKKYCPTNEVTSRNRRTVWNIATAPYSGAHFATFPPALVEPCIKAGTSERGCCPVCGKQWRRVVEDTPEYAKLKASKPWIGGGSQGTKSILEGYGGNKFASATKSQTTIGFRPDCEHYDGDYRRDYPQARSSRKRYQRSVTGDWWKRVKKRAGLAHWATITPVVFDPFAGSGTTVMVANQLGRRGVGLELSMDYLRLAQKRIGINTIRKWKNGIKVNEETSKITFGGIT